MDSLGETIHLYGTDQYITDGPGDAFRIVSGSVLVFVAPLKGGKPDRRLLLCEVGEGRLIPSLACRDGDYVNWRFVLVPRDEAELLRLPEMATSVLYRNFARLAGLENYRQEGFVGSILDYYKKESLKDDVYIGLGEKNRPGVDIASYGVIKQAFDAGEAHIEGGDPLYRAVAFACRRGHIPLPPAAKLRSLCGESFTVQEIARAGRFGCRRVVLDADWYQKDCGIILGTLEGRPVACVPKRQGSYQIYDGETETLSDLTAELAQTVEPRAYVLCRTLPDQALSGRDLMRFGLKSIRRIDLVYVLVLGLIGVLIGILLPTLNQKIYDEYIPLGNVGQLAQICAVIATFMIGSLLFDMVKNLSEFRVASHVGYDLQNAVYHRVFHLPESFFRRYDSADLAQRLGSAATLATTWVNAALVSGLGALFSLLYLFRMFKYSARLSWIALVMLAVYGALLYALSRASLQYDRRIESAKGEAGARLYQYLNGIEKLRMAGVEDRAAYEYLLPFSRRQSLELGRNRIDAHRLTLSAVSGSLFSIVFYLVIVRSKVNFSVGSFMAFNSAFGAFSSAAIGLIDGALSLYQLRPIYERIRPIFETAPEDSGEKEVPGRLQGEVSFSGVRFAYDKDAPLVLRGIDFTAAPGEYLGIVGPSGCGKSTLLKLLLGFEEPNEGQVCFDGKNLRQLDKRALRRNLGVVLQNGKLIAGSIFENITITSPNATMKDVQAVIRAVGLKEDVDQMPMGVHTMLSENSGTISGGQQQRILIARAIIGHPAILVFDEATSALDNVTQAAVCESLEKMNVTRIVVAHRLSTVKNCDRILVLRDGEIIEQGNYETLMAQNGFFARLAERQLVD